MSNPAFLLIRNNEHIMNMILLLQVKQVKGHIDKNTFDKGVAHLCKNRPEIKYDIQNNGKLIINRQ